VASAESFAGVKISGVFPDEEKKVTNLYEKVTDGNYFSEARKNSVLISEKLADKLKVKLGSKVVLTLQDINNNIISGAFRIVGLFNTHDNIFDESNLFVRYDDLARLMNMPDGAAHEIAIATTSNDAVNSVQKELSAKYPKLEVLSWYDLSPELGYLTDAMDLYMYIFIVIILLALLFGLVNTMLMVVLERVKEIGMLMAVGMNRLRIFMMIVLETVFLSLSGGVIGIILGTLISNYFESHKIPLSLWASAYEDLGYDAFVYTSLDSKLVITITLLVLLTGLIGSLYPAYKALQNNPSEALRID
jgi:ABC-type lipoprotein release transport system permease subunit